MAELTDKEKEALAAIGDSKARVDELSASVKHATDTTSMFGGQLTESFGALDQIHDWINKTGNSLENLGSITGSEAAKFGLLSIAIVGTTKKFQEFSQVLQGGAIGSFSDSFKGLIDTVKNSTGFALATTAGKQLYEMLLSMGGPTDKLSAAVSKGGAGLAAYAEQLLTGADNALRFQSGLLKAFAQAGDLNNMMTKGAGTLGALGEHFENLNEVTSHYNNIMTKAMRATGIESVDMMAKFLNEINKTPGAATDMAKGMDLAGVRTDALTGVIKIAHGAQLDVQQTFVDIRQAATDYGIGLNDSTRLISRYIDVQKSTGAQQEDVRNAILKTLGAFKSYTMNGTDAVKMTNSLTDSVKNWANSLKAVGVPIQQAMEMGARFTTQLKDMDEAQESFVSQTTGGAGGLAGTFDFEDLIRTGKTQEASAKVGEALSQQLKAMGGSGEIISREQARAMGAEGKEQFERQRMLLMSGVLGIKPQSREEAERMQAALAKGGDLFAGKATAPEDVTAGMDRAAQTGTELEDLSRTAVKEANITAEEVRLQGETIVLQTAQNAMAAGAGGINTTGRGLGVAGQESLKADARRGMEQAKGTGTEQAGVSIGALAKNLPIQIASMAQSFQRQMSEGESMEQVLKQTGLFNVSREQARSGEGKGQYIKEQQMLMSGMMGVKPKSTAEADAMIAAIQAAPDWQEPAGGAGTSPPGATTGAGGGKVLGGLPGTTPMGPRAGGAAATSTIRGIGATTAGGQVGRVIPGIGRGTEAAGTAAGGRTIGGLGTAGTTGPVPVSLADGASITVNLTGACPHCGRAVHQTQQTKMQNSASGADTGF